MHLPGFAIDHGSPTDLLAVHAPDAMVEQFESLGFGCEFGLVQRFCGAEPLGLFRFASLPYRHLLHFIQTRLVALENPELVTVGVMEGDEWWGLIEKFDIRYHTGKSAKIVPEADVLREERKRIAFLKRKFLEQLDEPTKIFVRKEFLNPAKSMQALWAALRAHAEHDLLWIRRVANAEEEGRTESLGTGIIAGSVTRVWDNAAPDTEGLATWLRILERTLHDLRPQQARQLHATSGAPQTRLLSAEWLAPAPFMSETDHAIPRPFAGAGVVRHTLAEAAPIHGGFVLQRPVQGFSPSRMYVASAHVWIPEDFEGTVDIRFPSLKMNWRWPANMKRRNCWQVISANIRFPEGTTACAPGIHATGKPGASFYSTAWRVEPGVAPGSLLIG